MKLLSLLDRLSAADAASAHEATPRRQLLRQLGQAGVRAAAVALPVSLAQSAQASTLADTALDVILRLLKLEDLLSALYTQALAPGAVLANPAQAAVRADFERVLRHQQGHAIFLRNALTGAGLTPPAAPAFDFSGRRNNPANPELFPNVLTDYAAFLQLAQQLEDASASIYLAQVPFLAADRQLLDAVLRMQTVEARHASHVRTLRRNLTASGLKSWPSNADAAPSPAVLVPSPAGGTAAPVSIYAFEANENQVTTGTTTVPFVALLSGTNAVQFVALSEAFDEPLPATQVTALFALFA
ncbi:MAG TPA: ferritin-like domain-containing protein [Hymenobacter sp.]|jgi:hypothetical protein|uniref:ferritin-like domain-containing protein n=1 Tax=Hymenobacter sp. TaxID=1898978 RepID=UPI002ED9A826